MFRTKTLKTMLKPGRILSQKVPVIARPEIFIALTTLEQTNQLEST
jgi:hypothetical protein